METAKKVFESKLPKKRKVSRRTLVLSAVALLLAAALIVGLVLLFRPTTPALVYQGVTVDPDMYAFWFAVLKSDFMIRHGLHGQRDGDALWSAACPEEGNEGKTWGEVLGEEIHTAIKAKLAAAVIFDELGYEMAENQRNRVNTYYEEMLEYAADGDRDELRELMAKYRSTPAALRRCAVIDMKVEVLYSQLSLVPEDMSTEELVAYYTSTYTRAKIVYINNEHEGVWENGVRVEYPLNLEGVGARNDDDKRELDRYVEGGGMTEALLAPYLERSDEGLHSEMAYPSGIYATLRSELALLEPEVANAVVLATPGSFVRVDTENGVRYVLGCALDTGAYTRAESAVFFSGFYAGAADAAITERAKARLSEIEEFPENYGDRNIFTIPHSDGKLKLCGMG